MSLPLVRRDYTITKLLGARNTGSGSVRKNQADIMVKVKDAFKASTWWTVTKSSDGVTSGPTDLWTDQSKLQLSGTVSWITLRNEASGAQYTGLVTVAGVTGWLEITWYCSPVAGFTGGSTAGRPTATDEYTVTAPGGADWLGTDAAAGTNPDPQFRAIVWVSTDGLNTRVAWMYDFQNGTLAFNAFWAFDQIDSAPSGPWLPWMSWMFDNGNGYNAPAFLMTANRFSASVKKVRTNSLNNEDVFAGMEQFGANYMVDVYPQNQTSLQYLWTGPPMLLTASLGPGRNGGQGYMTDVWLVGSTGGGVTPVFNNFDTAGSGAFLFIGAMMLPWDGTLGVPGLAVSTDRGPTTNFYGRACVGECECGPDNCDEATATLIAMRDGAKELADKVDDDSVSDIRWNVWINEGVEDCWKRIEQATGDASLATHDFTLAGGAIGNSFDVTTIPARDFRRLRFLEVNPGTTNRRRVPPFNFTEKDSGVRGSFSRVWDVRRRYRRMGNLIYVEKYEDAAGTYRLYYGTKALPAPLEMNCDALPEVLDEWSEYPQVFAAMKALGKEESDPGYLPTRLAELRADIAALKGEPDDDADASVIADVEEDGPGGDWP